MGQIRLRLILSRYHHHFHYYLQCPSRIFWSWVISCLLALDEMLAAVVVIQEEEAAASELAEMAPLLDFSAGEAIAVAEVAEAGY